MTNEEYIEQVNYLLKQMSYSNETYFKSRAAQTMRVLIKLKDDYEFSSKSIWENIKFQDKPLNPFNLVRDISEYIPVITLETII